MGSQTLYELKIVRIPIGQKVSSTFKCSEDVYRMFQPRFQNLDREEFHLVMLDTKHRILDVNHVSTGSLTATLVHPREVLKPVILTNSAAIILTHNHVSGDPYPSNEDKEITKRLKEIGDLIGIRVLDHVVIGENRFFSFADTGTL